MNYWPSTYRSMTRDGSSNSHSNLSLGVNYNGMRSDRYMRLNNGENYGSISKTGQRVCQNSHLTLENQRAQTNPAHILEVLRSQMAAIISRIDNESNILNNMYPEDFFEDFQNLFHYFKKAQVLLLEEFDRHLEVQASYQEQFTLARSQLLKISKERDLLSKELEEIQQALDETRDFFRNSAHQNPHKKKLQPMGEVKSIFSDSKMIRQQNHIDKGSCPDLSAHRTSVCPSILNSSTLDHFFDKTVTNPQSIHDTNRLGVLTNTSSAFESYFATSSQINSIDQQELILPCDNFKMLHAPINSQYDIKRKISQNLNLKKNSYNPTYSKVDDPDPEFKIVFDKLLNMIEAWCRSYANHPNKFDDDQIALHNPTLWSYMICCIFPGDREISETQVRDLINLASTRYRFVMRMISTYVFKDLLSLKNFYGFIDDVDKKLQKFESKMEERGMTAIVRQQLVDERDTLIRTVIEHKMYNRWRSLRLNQHTEYLRDMLRPLLNKNCDVTLASRDLGAIVVLAFDLCARLSSSSLTFQIIFPHMANKFNPNTMIICDNTSVKPQALQLATTRLKLVVTPIVTLRDDRGTTMKAKSLLLATVLTSS